MKHAQKMVMIPEHLMQSIETEHRLTAPAQLPTLTRLDQDMKQIMDSSFPEDQKVLLLDQLLRRYQGLTKQMKSEVTVKPAVVLPKSEPAPPARRELPTVIIFPRHLTLSLKKRYTEKITSDACND